MSQLRGYSAVGNRPAQNFCRSARFQARVDARIWPGLENHPSFGFPGLTWWNQLLIGIRRMDLNGEGFTHVKKLEQERESVGMAGELTEHLFGELLGQFL